jgi:hypothetical protein
MTLTHTAHADACLLYAKEISILLQQKRLATAAKEAYYCSSKRVQLCVIAAHTDACLDIFCARTCFAPQRVKEET